MMFISKNPLKKVSEVILILPSGDILDSEGVLLPENYVLSTDGENIILHWNNSNDNILVSYKNPSSFNSIYLILLTVIILGLIISIIYLLYKKEKATLTNLFGEEKEIIKYLMKKKDGCWTKEIVKELGISKVKLSRRLRNLEQKKLIERIPYGNENRIKLLKN